MSAHQTSTDMVFTSQLADQRRASNISVQKVSTTFSHPRKQQFHVPELQYVTKAQSRNRTKPSRYFNQTDKAFFLELKRLTKIQI
mmetsp:Transcript_16400/g.67709  ORF Transcript_16400/g.67709 Transcript_16400/m.67709 type:complete len:85 (-) Transcript_16400:15-269(-)